MNLIRKVLYQILGKTLYLRVISRSFITLYRLGLLSLFRKFRTHYLVRKLINDADTIIDIGANLGYYTSIFARFSGKSGMVYAVEPVNEYRKILEQNCNRYTNVKIVPYALSDREGSSEMGIPSEDKFRHGLTRIIESDETADNSSVYTVETRTPDSLFDGLEKLDYLKCDIEGYEIKVIPQFRKILEKFSPVIQIEIEKSNFEAINKFLNDLGYTCYIVSDSKLLKHTISIDYIGDFFYIPQRLHQQLPNIIN